MKFVKSISQEYFPNHFSMFSVKFYCERYPDIKHISGFGIKCLNCYRKLRLKFNTHDSIER